MATNAMQSIFFNIMGEHTFFIKVSEEFFAGVYYVINVDDAKVDLAFAFNFIFSASFVNHSLILVTIVFRLSQKSSIFYTLNSDFYSPQLLKYWERQYNGTLIIHSSFL